MKKFIPLEELTSKDKIEFIDSLKNKDNYITQSVIRNKKLLYYTSSRRQLWQALGHEYIEPELLDFIDNIPCDSVFYDIGASNGIFSIYAAKSKLKTFSFEPEAQNFSLLEINSYLNYKDLKYPIKTFNIALSDCEGLGELYVAKYEASGHMKILDKPQKVQESEEFKPDYIQNIMKFRLDLLIDIFKLPIPQYIKIDIDGSERVFFEGAKKTLQNNIVKSIFIELDNSEDNQNVLNDILSLGFHIDKKDQVQNYVDLTNYSLSRG